MNIIRPKLIFSTFRTEKTEDENIHSDKVVANILKGANIPFRQAIGTFEGIQEFSFVVDAKYRVMVEELCKTYEQDCYLEIDANRQGYLIYPDGSTVQIGTMHTSETRPDGDNTQIGSQFITFK